MNFDEIVHLDSITLQNDSETDRLLDSEEEDEEEKDVDESEVTTSPALKEHIDPKGSGLNLRPLEMIKTKAFWILWLTFALNGIGPTFVPSLYKVSEQYFEIQPYAT